MATRNRFPGRCYKCGDQLAEREGYYLGASEQSYTDRQTGEWRRRWVHRNVCDFCLATMYHDYEVSQRNHLATEQAPSAPAPAF